VLAVGLNDDQNWILISDDCAPREKDR